MTGASGAVAVVIAALVKSHGKEYLSACVLLAGLIQMTAGALRIGKWIRLVPHPVMLGFVNGLAIVMTKAQLVHFKDASTGAFLAGKKGSTMFGLTALSMFIMKVIPRITKSIPPSMATIAIVTALQNIFSLPAVTLLDIAGAETFRGGLSALPSISLPSVPMTAATFGIILPYAIVVASVGLIESLLTLQLVDGMVDDGARASTSAECTGQGIGNLAAGLTGGMGGCALIGQSIMNVEAGGTGKASGVAMSLGLGAGILFLSPMLARVPISALVGIMLLVCKSTFSWSSLRLVGKVPKLDFLIILLVSWVTVVEDLAVAVLTGTVLSALSFAWKQSRAIYAAQSVDPQTGWAVFDLTGPLFFGSTAKFESLFKGAEDAPTKEIIIDFRQARVFDHSALESINTVVRKLGDSGKVVHLRHLSPDCQVLLQNMNANADYEVIESDGENDPLYEPVEDAEMYDSKKRTNKPQ